MTKPNEWQAESEKQRTLKVKEMDLLVLEMANLRNTAERDSAQIQELETTLSQYKESVRNSSPNRG